MNTYKDRTFCASPQCKNECGRQLSTEDKAILHDMVWKGPENTPLVCYGYFCGEPEEKKDDTKN